MPGDKTQTEQVRHPCEEEKKTNTGQGRAPVVVVARVGQGIGIGSALGEGGAGEGQSVLRQRIGRQALKADAADARGRACKAGVHHGLGQAECLEDLSALVRRDRGDAHLGHHLEHACVDRLRAAPPHLIGWEITNSICPGVCPSSRRHALVF